VNSTTEKHPNSKRRTHTEREKMGSGTGARSSSVVDDDNDKYKKIEKTQKKLRSYLFRFLLILLGSVFLSRSLHGQQKTSTTIKKLRIVETKPYGELVKKRGIAKPAPLMETHEVEEEEEEEAAEQNNQPSKSFTPNEAELEQIVKDLDAQVRIIKATGVIMETDAKSLQVTKKLQDATRDLLIARYGPYENKPYRIQVKLQFQESIPDFEEKGPNGEFTIEMAPPSLVPHSVFTFMEIARNYKGGGFHRVAGHVLQVMVKGGFKHLAFQEYSKEFPHKKGTVGYAGRPSGPAWYVSIENNTRNHGPGSQQKHNPYEADAAFGTVIEGFEDVILDRVKKIPGQGFVNDSKKWVLITDLVIMVEGSGPDATSDGYVEWVPKGTRKSF